MNPKDIIRQIKLLENPENVAGMARFGIRPKSKIYGVPIPKLRKMAKILGKNHKLALELWDSKIHEAKILAGMIADPEILTRKHIKKWASEFDSWDVCDQVCMNLFDKSKAAKNQIISFSQSKQEFVKRTAFALMAALASHDKKMKDGDFISFFPLIKKASIDERNFVKKAVNWALRGIGKRTLNLNKQALKLAKEIQKINSKSAKWVASNAILELADKKVSERIKCRSDKR